MGMMKYLMIAGLFFLSACKEKPPVEFPEGTIVWHKIACIKGVVVGTSVSMDGIRRYRISTGSNTWISWKPYEITKEREDC